jgi:hypothetical protein
VYDTGVKYENDNVQNSAVCDDRGIGVGVRGILMEPERHAQKRHIRCPLSFCLCTVLIVLRPT